MESDVGQGGDPWPDARVHAPLELRRAALSFARPAVGLAGAADDVQVAGWFVTGVGCGGVVVEVLCSASGLEQSACRRVYFAGEDVCVRDGRFREGQKGRVEAAAVCAHSDGRRGCGGRSWEGGLRVLVVYGLQERLQ